ncbi:MAG: glutamate racemase [Ignavibacteriae bacterium HGW-Ignavibacteriae-2]|jgi:glutamate racemase|nr:glutamate racemase [Bacteroidota bacterium]PKL89790.1 MAG: glutamate racemase [Ignavibacteriae bacterium HGW-Ignavibacteriae-2]
MNRTNPIGIFDSGIGGLTVVKRISSFFPNENIIYFGDTARVPYGNKSNDTVIEYALQDANFLFKKNVKLIIVACNTASSVAIDVLKEKFQVPVIGMIEPGAQLAIDTTNNKRIGVIGTYATIGNHAYSSEIKKHNPKIEVFEKPCPLFVPLAEEGWMDHPSTKLIAEEYLNDFINWDIDTLILGCTHYPLLSAVIEEVMGDKVTLIDSGTAAASVVEDHLNGRGLRNTSVQQGQYEYYLSDLSGKFKDVAERFLGRTVGNINKVDLEQLI